jgi:hypothetical protein
MAQESGKGWYTCPPANNAADIRMIENRILLMACKTKGSFLSNYPVKIEYNPIKTNGSQEFIRWWCC